MVAAPPRQCLQLYHQDQWSHCPHQSTLLQLFCTHPPQQTGSNRFRFLCVANVTMPSIATCHWTIFYSFVEESRPFLTLLIQYWFNTVCTKPTEYFCQYLSTSLCRTQIPAAKTLEGAASGPVLTTWVSPNLREAGEACSHVIHVAYNDAHASCLNRAHVHTCETSGSLIIHPDRK